MNVCRLDNHAPLFNFTLDKSAKLLRGAPARDRPLGGDLFTHLWEIENVFQLLPDFVRPVLRHTGRYNRGRPGVRVEAWESAFAHGRNIGKRWNPLCRADREHLKSSAF